MKDLDETQRRQVAEWVGQGLRLAEIQNRIASEFNVRLTYMDVRLLVDDLNVTPKDAEPKPASTTTLQAASTRPEPPTETKRAGREEKTPAHAASAGVSLTVDQIARPGAVVSGSVSFTDGQKADWYLDQAGRLGLAPEQNGYRPSAADVQQFQSALENELSKIGF